MCQRRERRTDSGREESCCPAARVEADWAAAELDAAGLAVRQRAPLECVSRRQCGGPTWLLPPPTKTCLRCAIVDLGTPARGWVADVILSRSGAERTASFCSPPPPPHLPPCVCASCLLRNICGTPPCSAPSWRTPRVAQKRQMHPTPPVMSCRSPLRVPLAFGPTQVGYMLYFTPPMRDKVAGCLLQAIISPDR